MQNRSPDGHLRLLFLSDDDGTLGLLAEGLLRAQGPTNISAGSACAAPRPPDPRIEAALTELGVDPRGLTSQALADVDRGASDIIIALSRQADEGPGAAVTPCADLLAGEATLNIGAPVHLCWPLPEATGPRDVTGLRADRDRLAEHIRNLTEQGYLVAFATQRSRMTQLADLMSEGVVAHDPNRRIYLFNQAAERATGCRREDVLGRDCHEVFPPKGICGAHCAFKDDDPDPPGDRSFEVPFTTPTGEHRKLQVTSRPIAAPTGAAGDVLAVIHDATEMDELRYQLGRLRSFHGMVGQSAAVREVFDTIRQVASSDYPVLITGESGTGKELAASAIHAESLRSGGPFVPVNCGALPENILESELFGHVRGAFTGAIRSKKGRFELADGGTLFLDEVGELSPAFQVKLLRVLQEQRFERVGGEKEVRVDVRIIAATNRDLRTMIAAGSFREDLFYRLCVVPVVLPPLRDRLEDFPLLVQHVLETVRQQTGKNIRRVSDEVLGSLMQHRWPGNIRELINALQFASVRCEGEHLLPEHLPPELRLGGAAPLPSHVFSPSAARPSPDRGGRRLKLRTDMVNQALEAAGGNKVKAAKILGVGRATLYRFLKDNPVS